MKTPAHIVRTILHYGPWAAREFAARGRPHVVVNFYGETPGDDLMCTTVLRELKKRGQRGIWMMTRFPALFELNADIDQVVAFDFRYQRMVTWFGGHSLEAHYGGHDMAADRSPIPARHILALMCASCGISGPVTLRPYLTLTDSERANGRIAQKQIALHSSGMSAFSAMKNKEWGFDRFQGVVNALRDEFTFVQLGAKHDRPLEHCVDLRGRTSIRESAAILASSLTFLGQVGFLMHLARSVNRRSVIVYGGRELPWQSGYSCNINLATALPCSPCWRWNTCDNPIERECLQRITAEEVVLAVRTQAAQHESILVEDIDNVPVVDAMRSAAAA